MLKHKTLLRNWIREVFLKEKMFLSYISYNFCDDPFLLKINKRYLNHNNYTDIITFDLSEGDSVSADIYISINRVKENALEQANTFSEELFRVMIHGALHLCGYKDKTLTDIKQMRHKENHYISLLKLPHVSREKKPKT